MNLRTTTSSVYFQAMLFFFIVLLLQQCANPVAPTGGPVDEDPPVLDTLASSPLLPVNFTKKDIVLEFNEYLSLNNPATSIVISPPLQKRPNYNLRGKRVIIEFDKEEELLENTTYTINFGESIRDLTEGNILQNFLYAFSTGPVIDSLEMTIKLTDAFSGEPIEGAMAMLHPPGRDSALLEDKPIYFATTDQNGMATLQYLKAGSYEVFGLKDENRNFLLDLSSEKVGFFPEKVDLDGSKVPLVEIKMFQREERLFLSHKKWVDPGRLLLKYNRNPAAFNFHFPDMEVQPTQTLYGDSLVFHFGQQIPEDSFLVIVTQLPSFRDTLAIAQPKDGDRPRLQIKSYSQGLKPNEKATLQFNQLLAYSNDSLIQFQDTLDEAESQLRGNSEILDDKLILNPNLAEGKRGRWILLPGAIIDTFGRMNDSIPVDLRRESNNSLSSLHLTVAELDSNMQYILILETQRGEVKRQQISNVPNYLWKLDYLRPDNYSLRVIEDANFNSRWDPGIIIERVLPERVSTINLIDLRANWEFEQTVIPFEKIKDQ